MQGRTAAAAPPPSHCNEELHYDACNFDSPSGPKWSLPPAVYGIKLFYGQPLKGADEQRSVRNQVQFHEPMAEVDGLLSICQGLLRMSEVTRPSCKPTAGLGRRQQ